MSKRPDETLQEWLDRQKTRPLASKLEVLGAFPTLARELGLKSSAPLEPWTIHHSKPDIDVDE
jgi:hypothetical protein